jgi:hypothetical protein
MQYKSALMTTASGSVGGFTATRNRFAALVGRARVKPVNPRSNYQRVVRTVLNNMAIRWKYLTAAQRTSWKAYADATPYTGRLGDSIVLTPEDFYVATGGVVLSAIPVYDIANFNLPPSMPGLFPSPTMIITPPPSGTGFSIRLYNNSTTETCRFILDISPPVSPGKNFFTGPWDSVNKVFTTTVAIGGNILINFTTQLLGLKYFFQVRAWSYNPPNRISGLSYGSAIAQTAT